PADRAHFYMTPPITCYVADDHPAVVQAVIDYLGAHNVEIVGQARDGDEALTGIEKTKTADAMLDLRMPRMDGIEDALRAGGRDRAAAVADRVSGRLAGRSCASSARNAAGRTNAVATLSAEGQYAAASVSANRSAPWSSCTAAGRSHPRVPKSRFSCARPR